MVACLRHKCPVLVGAELEPQVVRGKPVSVCAPVLIVLLLVFGKWVHVFGRVTVSGVPVAVSATGKLCPRQKIRG